MRTKISILVLLGLAAIVSLWALLRFPDTLDLTAQQNPECEVHRVRMHELALPAACGEQLGMSLGEENLPGYFEAFPKLFPHTSDPSKTFLIGNCYTGSDPKGHKRAAIKHVKVWDCPRCKEARISWIREARDRMQKETN